MNNIEKLYVLAEVYQCNMPDIDCSKECEKCEDYNPFTPEKQLELIKFIEKIDWADCLTTYFYAVRQLWVFIVSPVKEFSNEQLKYFASEDKDFSQALSGLIIELWDDLTDKQKEEIKEILK